DHERDLESERARARRGHRGWRERLGRHRGDRIKVWYGRHVSRFPGLSNAGESVPASIFAKLREHLARFPGDVIPLQIGDTHLHPPATLDRVEWSEMPTGDIYASGTPAGWAPLVAAIVEKVRAKNRLPIGEANVQV